MIAPSGTEIANWIAESYRGPRDKHVCIHNQGAEGFGFPGCESDRGVLINGKVDGYCYVWVEAEVDLDMTWFGLIDVRTDDGADKPFTETRDFLFVSVDMGRVECEWLNLPVRFSAPTQIHRDRRAHGMRWFGDRITAHFEAHHPPEDPVAAYEEAEGHEWTKRAGKWRREQGWDR